MTLIGADYASVDGNEKPNFTAAKQAGARFVIPRAIYGRSVIGGTTPFRDPVWARDKDAIVAAGLKRTAYLFLCFEKKGVHTPSPEVQAQTFIDYVKLDRNKDFVPMVDVEEASNLMSAIEMHGWVVRACRKLRDHFGAWPGIYTSARVWQENLENLPAGELINCPLWLAKPWPWAVRTTVHLDGAPAYSPSMIPQWGLNNYWLYQYQGDALGWPGFNRTVDANRFHMIGKDARGDNVVWLQQRLGITADGIFGDQTETAVKDLQKRHGLVLDGIVGVNTFAPLCWSNLIS